MLRKGMELDCQHIIKSSRYIFWQIRFGEKVLNSATAPLTLTVPVLRFEKGGRRC